MLAFQRIRQSHGNQSLAPQLAHRLERAAGDVQIPQVDDHADVLRWYAHNRGYDGNRRWSATEVEAQKEDTEKEANARTLSLTSEVAQSTMRNIVKALN